MLVKPRKLFQLAASTALLSGLAIAAAPAARADIVFDNTNAASDISASVFNEGPLAQSFNSGGGGRLSDIQLVLTSSTPLNPNGVLQVTLFADNNTAPGIQLVSLGTLLNSAVTAGATGTFEFSPVADTFLTADTTYWIGLTETAPNGIEWLGSDDLSGVGVSDSFLYASDVGVNPASSFGAFQMAVDVPEPGTVALFMSGLIGLALLRRRGYSL